MFSLVTRGESSSVGVLKLAVNMTSIQFKYTSCKTRTESVNASCNILQEGASVECPALIGRKPYYTPVHDAVWFNQLDCLRLLCEQGADLSAKNKDRVNVQLEREGQSHQ
eukprot:5796330-Amphidinium_carterae.1